jgi:hypothetical protein
MIRGIPKVTGEISECGEYCHKGFINTLNLYSFDDTIFIRKDLICVNGKYWPQIKHIFLSNGNIGCL